MGRGPYGNTSLNSFGNKTPAQCLAIKLKCLHRLWSGIAHDGILLDFHLGFQKCFQFLELLLACIDLAADISSGLDLYFH